MTIDGLVYQDGSGFIDGVSNSMEYTQHTTDLLTNEVDVHVPMKVKPLKSPTQIFKELDLFDRKVDCKV